MVRMIAETHLQRQTGSNNADMMLLSAILVLYQHYMVDLPQMDANRLCEPDQIN